MVAALGFLRNGDYVLYDDFKRKQAFLYHDGTTLPVEMAGGPVRPEITDDGELSQFKANAQGRMAVFRYRNQKWVQVTPVSAHYSDAYVQNEQGLGVATIKSPNSPWWAVMVVNGREVDMRPILKTKYSKALAVTADGSILFMTTDKLYDWSYFWWRDGKITRKVTMPKLTGQIGINIHGEYIICSRYEERTETAFLVGPKQASEIRGPMSRLQGVVCGKDLWLGGYEVDGDDHRAVLIANDHPYYLDDLVQNIQFLKKQYRFRGKFSAVSSIAQDGRLIAKGFVTFDDGSNGEVHFLLTPAGGP